VPAHRGGLARGPGTGLTATSAPDTHRADQGRATDDFEALVRDQAPGLYRFALSLTRNGPEAEDLVQETFTRAFARRSTFRGESAPGAWLRRILHNLAIDRARHAAHELPVADIEGIWGDVAYTVDPHEVIARAETREEIEDALVRLPFGYRAVVVLHDIEGWTSARIAEKLGAGLPAVKQRLRRGRMMLVSALAAGPERRRALSDVPLHCSDARRRVSDYMDDDLPAAERRLIERHLATCPTCPPLYAALVGVRERLGGMRDPDSVVPPNLAERIGSRLVRR
jgi:RNA polymerase sigma-70 factor, ECF subfamily